MANACRSSLRRSTSSPTRTRELLQECLQEVLAFYGLGLDRMLEVAKSAPGGEDAYDRLVRDSIVRGMLLIHGLHPVPLGTCVKPLKRCGLICKATAATSSFSVWTMIRPAALGRSLQAVHPQP